ncbi:hypothetical protein B5D82_17415 [Cognaticolwellia beringensis]|uniref:Peptidase M28 domain-containing protein n=1 Tax=Cognaticolwellia beringensis TaxID=1967665 RepID=A0A222GC20_9GAMM|nr:hypothetical protein B5D82_17415 [Cognaticolwellia beringensis]
MINLKPYCLLLVVLISTACSIHKNSFSKIGYSPQETVLKHLHYLSLDSLQGRKIGTAGGKSSQDYIVAQLELNNIKPLSSEYLAPFSITGFLNSTQGNNVVGLITGTEFPNRFIVISAHFDHIGGHGNKIYNGADDNASGTSALLYYAKKLQHSPLRYSVIVLFTDGEEVNLNGAKSFIKQNAIILDKIVLNINLDMIAGHATTKYLRYISRGLNDLLGEEKSLVFEQKNYAMQLKKGFRQRNPCENKNIKWQLASDHGVFYRQRIPFIYFGVGCHKNYHQISDTFENINREFFLSAVDIIYQQIKFIDQNI